MGGIDLELRMVMKKMTNFVFNKCKHIKKNFTTSCFNH